ncbi:hypothetical protein CUJ83_07930 [Methanocella sp. CWC-04]|uniref:Uncharacterized protein n=1 Tax=Methanooceanicella nereidis TaxID=2052831 RepID=A0AAP2RF31_9EURY|nr:hypothetical protein [Methanocella sp. CWC-04]MCD1294925.1 hypothetical protein [Methanocella sp. CWC-04]
MPKVEVPEDLHKNVKKFAIDHNLTIKDAYAQLVQFALDQKYDKNSLKKILKDKGSSDNIIVGS